MSLTSIGNQKTPGQPIELTFAADTGLPSDEQEVLLIGRKDAASGTAATGTVVTISNVSDLEAATEEANTKFGEGSELAKMVIAAVAANAGGSTFPALKAVALPSDAVDFGTNDAALVAAKRVKAEYLVSCFDGNDETLTDKVESAAQEMSGAQRVHNNQFGTIGVAANQSVSDPANLPEYDSQFIAPVYLRDSDPAYTVGELAAAYAAKLAANVAPFNPVNGDVIEAVTAPEDSAENLTIGAGLESETVLDKGWCPLKVKPNGDVAIVRSVTSRITTNGTTEATSYYDVQDFNVLYLWRKTLLTRFSQPDFEQAKASDQKADLMLTEMLRLAAAFEDQGMFQSVKQLAPYFQVERNASDRHRFDYKTPVNVIPGLHVIAGNIEATTQFDTVDCLRRN